MPNSHMPFSRIAPQVMNSLLRKPLFRDPGCPALPVATDTAAAGPRLRRQADDHGKGGLSRLENERESETVVS